MVLFRPGEYILITLPGPVPSLRIRAGMANGLAGTLADNACESHYHTRRIKNHAHYND
jgi:hypothetical protein